MTDLIRLISSLLLPVPILIGEGVVWQTFFKYFSRVSLRLITTECYRRLTASNQHWLYAFCLLGDQLQP